MTTRSPIPQLRARLRRVFEDDRQIQFVYVFGSTARGDGRDESDIDLAVHRSEPAALLDEADLEHRLATALGRDVDLVMLNRAPLWLQFRILGEGELLFSRDEVGRVRFRARVEKEFLDFRPFHEAYLDAVRQRARQGRLVVDRSRVDQLLVLLARYVRILRELSETSREAFVRDPRNYGSGERFLQLAIETTLNVGHHIIAAQGLRQPKTYAEVFAVLGREGVLESAFATRLEAMARMRNRLVHVYEDIDPAAVHDLLTSRLGDFDRFAQQITAYLDAEEGDQEDAEGEPNT